MKIKPSLKRAVVLCALVAFTIAQPRAQVAVPEGLAPGDHHRWMGELFSRDQDLMDQSLARFIFPGTHDSGTFGLQYAAACEGCEGAERFYDVDATCREYMPPALEGVCDGVNGFMEIVGQSWGEAQHLTVGGLLDAGARHFDLRFFRATEDDATRTSGGLVQGSFYIHHSLAGADSTSILDDIDRFLDHPTNAQEIVILEFSKMKEGTGDMDADSIGVFFDQVRSRFGDKMAKRQTSTCAANPDGCSATQRFGHATTLREFLAQGSQVIVTCASCAIEGDDIWDSLTWTTPSGVSGLNADAGEGYPAPDNAYFPWRTDRQYVSMIQQLSVKRDSYPQDKMFALGTQIGLDDDGVSMIRGLSCHLDPENVSGECGAVNNDWDAFRGLEDVTNFINPMALAAVVGLRRDRVNIVTFDHYDFAITEEIFKLNLGATQVFHRIDRVENTDAMDLDSGPDYYPWFQYLGVAPVSGQVRFQRYNQIQNEHDISPRWPSWKSYPNAWETANVVFGINDADPGIGLDEDDQSLINIPPPQAPFGMNLYAVQDKVPISACVGNAANCLKLDSQQSVTGGNGPDSSNVSFSRNACVWSWAPHDLATGVDPASLCGEVLPQLRIYDGMRVEGNNGSNAVEFVIALSAASLKPQTVMFSTSDGTARAGSDYTAVTRMIVTFNPGETRAIAKVFVNGDTDVEHDEGFTVTIGQPSGATIAGDSASGTILNDDTPAGPALSIPGSQSGGEGAAITFALGTLTDGRPAGPWTIDVNWGDGASTSYSVTAPGPLTGSHTYADNGTYTVGVSATAADGVRAEPITFTATIANASPGATLRNNGPIDEGGAATIAFSNAIDPSTADTAAGLHYAYSCTGAALDQATYASSGSAATTSCTFADDGVYTVRGRIIDKDGGYKEYTTVVKVRNVAPSITAAGSVVDENGVATVSGTITDPGVRDTFMVTVSWGDGTFSPHSFAAGTTTYTVTHQYLDDDPTATPSDTSTVMVSVVDKDGGKGSVTTGATVRNAFPQVGSLQFEDETGATIDDTLFALSGLPVDLEAVFTDVGTRDTHQGSIDWGDGTSGAGTVTESGGAGTLSARHTWSIPGRFTVRVTVTDDDTGVGTRQAAIVVTDGQGAVCTLTKLITPMLRHSNLDRSTEFALIRLLGQIQGNSDGRAANGACDMFAKDNYVAAVVKLAQAVGTIEDLIAGGGLTEAQADVLRQVEVRLTLAAKWTAVRLVRTTTDERALARAAALGELADAAMASRDYPTAIGHWLEAVRRLARGHRDKDDESERRSDSSHPGWQP